MNRINTNELLETLFYNIMMNLEEEMLVAPENNVMSQSLYESNPIKMVISDEEKNKLVPIKYANVLHKEQNTACFITQDDFKDDDDVIQLPCNHCFTPDSIIKWLAEECAECPVCRYKFASVEKRDVDANLNNSDEEEFEEDLPNLIPMLHTHTQNYAYMNNNIFLNNFMNTFANEINYNHSYNYNYNDGNSEINENNINDNSENDDDINNTVD